MTDYDTNVRKTPEWQAAEQQYGELYSRTTFSIVGESPTPGMPPEGVDLALSEIIEFCPEYYPVWFHRAEYMLRVGNNSQGEAFFDKAFDIMVRLVNNEEEFEQTLNRRIAGLEKLLRYDLAAKYLEKAVRLFPESASFYDDLAYARLQPPEPDKNGALQAQLNALEIDPDNEYYINNLGWLHLVMENYSEAQDHFEKALKFDPDNESFARNLETAEYMQEHRLNYFQYLVRSADMGELREYVEEELVEDVIDICDEYNADRVEAFKVHHLRKKALPPHEILNVIQFSDFFLKDISVAAREYVFYDKNDFFLYENIELLHRELRYFYYLFIIGSEAVDGHFLEDVGHAIKVFYDFLREGKLITADQFNRFSRHLESMTTEFSRNLDEYYRLLHDQALDEEDRETAILQLFGVE